MIDSKNFVYKIFIFNFELFSDSEILNKLCITVNICVPVVSCKCRILFWFLCQSILNLLHIYVKCTQCLQISIEILRFILMSVLSFGTHLTDVKTKD